MQSFTAWPASSNQDAYDLSDAGFFYTGAVLYKQKPVYYKKKYFLENPANKNCFCYRRKRPQNLFPLRFCSKGLESYWFGMAGACSMESEMCLRTTYKKHCIIIICCFSNKVMYGGCGLVKLFLFRIQLYPVRVPACMFGSAQTPRQTPALSFVNSSLVRSRSLPARLTVVSRESYT